MPNASPLDNVARFYRLVPRPNRPGARPCQGVKLPPSGAASNAVDASLDRSGGLIRRDSSQTVSRRGSVSAVGEASMVTGTSSRSETSTDKGEHSGGTGEFEMEAAWSHRRKESCPVRCGAKHRRVLDTLFPIRSLCTLVTRHDRPQRGRAGSHWKHLGEVRWGWPIQPVVSPAPREATG